MMQAIYKGFDFDREFFFPGAHQHQPEFFCSDWF
jgi:hypothetical protein